MVGRIEVRLRVQACLYPKSREGGGWQSTKVDEGWFDCQGWRVEFGVHSNFNWIGDRLYRTFVTPLS